MPGDLNQIGQALENYVKVYCKETTATRYLEVFAQLAKEYPSILENIAAPTEQDIVSFLAWMKDRGYKPSVIRYRYFFLKTLCERVMRGRWPMRPQDAPPEPETFKRPILEAERIANMIIKMRSCPDLGARTRFVASTIFGARRAEIADMEPSYLNMENGIIQLQTKKGGDVRARCFPDRYPELGVKVMPFLEPTALIPLTVDQASDLFKRIEWYCGYTHVSGFGWHSIRRRLVTHFRWVGVPDDDIYTFMRWKPRKTIIDRYDATPPTEPTKKLEDIDLKIFRVHPFLKYWAGSELEQAVPAESSMPSASSLPSGPPQSSQQAPSEQDPPP